jgi:hypothetical protein
MRSTDASDFAACAFVKGEASVDDRIRWLLEGDPAIAWQVRADLLDDPGGAASERARVAVEGWGAELLELQDPEGTWAGALYSPKWTSTTYTLLLLHRFGLEDDHPAARLGVDRLVEGARVRDGGLTLAKTVPEPEACITGMLVLLASRFGGGDSKLESALDWLLSTQMPDGGWNCELVRRGATHGSFHTTITVLEALYERTRRRPDPALDDAAERAREFFLDHHLYRSHRTGEVADERFTRFSFPPYWHFDVLRGLDHFRLTAPPGDPRLDDPIELVRQRQHSDGRWKLQNVHRNRTWFTMEGGGHPSRWNTLRSLRVLRWWRDDN